MSDDRISGQLRYITIRILTSRNEDTNWANLGTGFFYSFSEDVHVVPHLITNKHVIDNAAAIGLQFHITADDNKAPVNGPGRLVAFKSSDVKIVRHPSPDVDLAAIDIAPIVLHAISNEGWQPYIRCLRKSELPSESLIKDVSSIEDVIMVGYPIGIIDAANNFPVVRRGITSTPYQVNYQGKSEFLADIPVYEGSSGSPIFLLNEGSWHEKGDLVIGTRFALLGVLYAGHTETVDGHIVPTPVPTNLEGVAKVRHMINLGLCLKSSLIEDLAKCMS